MEKRSHTQILTKVRTPAAPSPCTALPAKNADIVSPTEHNKLPMKNINNEANNKGFLPQMSDSLPQMGIVALLARIYELPIHVYPELEWKWPAMAGTVVVMMVTSNAATKTAAQSDDMTTDSCRRLRELLPASPSLEAVVKTSCWAGSCCVVDSAMIDDNMPWVSIRIELFKSEMLDVRAQRIQDHWGHLSRGLKEFPSLKHSKYNKRKGEGMISNMMFCIFRLSPTSCIASEKSRSRRYWDSRIGADRLLPKGHFSTTSRRYSIITSLFNFSL